MRAVYGASKKITPCSVCVKGRLSRSAWYQTTIHIFKTVLICAPNAGTLRRVGISVPYKLHNKTCAEGLSRMSFYFQVLSMSFYFQVYMSFYFQFSCPGKEEEFENPDTVPG